MRSLGLESVMALAGIWNFFMPVSVAIDSNCDFYQNLMMGQEYYIYNSEYPGLYKASASCRWIAKSQVGSQIVISCEEISLPSTRNCNGDKLSISLTGSENFTDAHNYCGVGSISLVSQSNALTVGLFSTSNSPGGKFVCSLTSILVNQPEEAQAAPVAGCNCGWKKGTRIVGGNQTLINEFPSMAGLIDAIQRKVYCGATIISEWYVLTAAHCLLNKNTGRIAVLVGDHDLTTGKDTTAAALHRVSAFEMHPNYNSTTQVNDIGIIRTATMIQFSIAVGPACLPFRYTAYDFTGQTVTVLGWGQLQFTGQSSDTLQKVDLTVTSNEYCIQQFPDEVIRSSNICTYTPGKDACTQDSGGPLLWHDASRNRFQLIGIISYGWACATNKPGVNTRVSSYIQWIVSRTSDATYCIK